MYYSSSVRHKSGALCRLKAMRIPIPAYNQSPNFTGLLNLAVPTWSVSHDSFSVAFRSVIDNHQEVGHRAFNGVSRPACPRPYYASFVQGYGLRDTRGQKAIPYYAARSSCAKYRISRLSKAVNLDR